MPGRVKLPTLDLLSIPDDDIRRETPVKRHFRETETVLALVVLTSIFDSWCSKSNERWSQKAKACSVYAREEYYSDRIATRNAVDIWENEVSGYDKLMIAEDFLENSIGVDREIFQREVHERLTAICAHLIVGKEWQFIGHDIAAQRPGWEEWQMSLALFVSAFRRVGKTSSLQQFIDMLMCKLNKISIACFSTGQRISRLFGMGVYKMICLSGFEHQIRKFTDELLIMASDEDDPINVKILFMAPSDSEINDFSALTFMTDDRNRTGDIHTQSCRKE